MAGVHADADPGVAAAEDVRVDAHPRNLRLRQLVEGLDVDGATWSWAPGCRPAHQDAGGEGRVGVEDDAFEADVGATAGEDLLLDVAGLADVGSAVGARRAV